MKLLILLFLFSTKLFAAELSIETMREIKCYYYDDQNRYPVLLLYFSGNEEKMELTVNQAENNLDDEATITTIYNEKITVNEMENKIVVTGHNLSLEMITPIAYWNHGDFRSSKLELKTTGINVNLVCEQQ